MVVVIAGFSLTNRLLLYASLLLTPGQAQSAIGSNLPISLGFLAYNWYNQCSWYSAIKNHQLHALSLLPVHFNTMYAITYLGGVTSGNIFLGTMLGLGTAALMIFNTVAAWTSWATNMTEGYHVFQFFFFGWRTLTPGWHKFFLLWQIGDSLLAANCVVAAIVIAIGVTQIDSDDDDDSPWLTFLTYYGGGSVIMSLISWPLILWVELIIARNHIESSTDMVAVWLFVAQIGTLFLPAIFYLTKQASMFCIVKSVSREAVHTLPLVNLNK